MSWLSKATGIHISPKGVSVSQPDPWGAAGDAVGAVTGGNQQQAQGASQGGIGQAISSFLTGNGGLNALGLAQGVSSILDAKKAGDYANKATSTIENAYNEKAPLRAQALSSLLNPQAPNVGALQAMASQPVSKFMVPPRPAMLPHRPDVGNPYAAQG